MNDYVLVSNSLFTKCQEFDIVSRLDSDHLPLRCTFQSRAAEATADVIDRARDLQCERDTFKFTWDNDKLTCLERMCSQQIFQIC